MRALQDNPAPNPTTFSAGMTKTDDVQLLDPFEFIRARGCEADVLREITEFLDSQETSHPFQYPQWGDGGSYYALYRVRAKIRWFAQCGIVFPGSRLLRPIRALVVNRGPVSDDVNAQENGLAKLIEVSRHKGYAFIEIVPDWVDSLQTFCEKLLQQHQWKISGAVRSSLRLNLITSADELLGSFRKVTRYEIRRCERKGIEIAAAKNEADCREWLQTYRKMAETKGFSAEDGAHMMRVLRWFLREPGRGRLLLARNNGVLVGGVVVVRSASRCWYVYGATSKEEGLSAGHLLQWRAIEWAKAQGCREYDFGGYTEGATSGPAFFKRGFCDRVVNFLPAHRHVTSDKAFRVSEVMARLRQRLPRSPRG